MAASSGGGAEGVGSSSTGQVTSTGQGTSNVGAGSRPKLLVVDGDASSRSVLEVALAKDGFDVRCVTSGREAIRLLADDRALPSMVVLSSDLHGEDGYSLCAQIRGDRRLGTVPVMMLARRAEDGRQTLAEVVGVDEFIAKPAFARDIAILIRLRLQRRQSDGTVAFDSAITPIRQTLRAVLSAQKSGQLLLGNGKGYLSFHGGKVIDAEVGSEVGPEAVLRMLALGDGAYRVRTLPLLADTRFGLTLRDLLGTLYPKLERFEQLVARSVGLSEVFEVNFTALTRSLPSMPDAVNEVVRLFDGKRSVREVLYDSTLSEIIALQVTNRLFAMGVVTRLSYASTGTDGQRHQAPLFDELKDAPKLFEPAPTEAAERMRQLFGDTTAQPIVTAVPAARMPSPDWYQPEALSAVPEPKPTDPQFAPAREFMAPPAVAEVPPALERQLNAFNVRTVVEPNSRGTGRSYEAKSELQRFNEGLASAEASSIPIMLTHAVERGAAAATSPIAVEGDVHAALEQQFFAQPDAAPATVVEAVLGPKIGEFEEPKPDGGGRVLGVLAAVGALLGGVALITWELTTSNGAAANPPPSVLVAPPAARVEVAPDEVVAVEAPELIADDSPVVSDALAAATRLYESGRIKQAVKALESVVEGEASNTSAWVMLGLARYDSGDSQGAKEAATTALALDPNAARAHLLLATLHLDQGKRPLAEEELKAYLALEPNGAHAADAKALLKR